MLAAETSVVPPSDSLAPLMPPPVDWKQIVQPLEPFLRAVSKRMEEQIRAFETDLATYASYALSAQGKQLRPALVGLAAAATGKIQDAHITVAVIIEMVHLATLVHDDVMDEATLRRGRPTLAANWGNEISVLLGDCLFAKSLKLAASFPTTEVCRAVSSSTDTVCEGEILQTLRRRDMRGTRAEYLKVLAMKTGELFALACDMGAYLSGAPAHEREALRGYGLALGTAYQIYDDCLDVFGHEDTAGKSLGTDLVKGKVTLPLLVLLERNDAVAVKIETLMGDYQPQNFSQVAALLRRHGALAESLRVINVHLETARHLAGGLRESEARAGLMTLCGVLAAQTAALGGES